MELDEPKENSLVSQIDQHLGWASQKADGTRVKKALNVSLLIGKTEADPRSTIRFLERIQVALVILWVNCLSGESQSLRV